MPASPYTYSKDAKLRISIINKYWKMSNEDIQILRKMIGKTDENRFSGFSLIDYHSFVAPPDNKGKLTSQTPLTDVKFKFDFVKVWIIYYNSNLWRGVYTYPNCRVLHDGLRSTSYFHINAHFLLPHALNLGCKTNP